MTLSGLCSVILQFVLIITITDAEPSRGVRGSLFTWRGNQYTGGVLGGGCSRSNILTDMSSLVARKHGETIRFIHPNNRAGHGELSHLTAVILRLTVCNFLRVKLKDRK